MLVTDTSQDIPDPSEVPDAVDLMLKSQEARIVALEIGAKKTPLKRMTESVSASALFLGLILTFVTLYDAFVTKPKAERISRLSQFNQAVNSAAKTRQELMRLQMQTTDPQLQLAMASQATPQVLNDISTARAMLNDMNNDDVGISQLSILISEAFTAGDLDSAKNFVARAVELTGRTLFQRSEALRYQGRYLFASGDPAKGRKSYLEALNALGDSPGVTMARAYDLGDLVLLEYSLGDCTSAAEDLQMFATTLALPHVTPQARSQMAITTRAQIAQLQNQHCPAPQDLEALLHN